MCGRVIRGCCHYTGAKIFTQRWTKRWKQPVISQSLVSVTERGRPTFRVRFAILCSGSRVSVGWSAHLRSEQRPLSAPVDCKEWTDVHSFYLQGGPDTEVIVIYGFQAINNRCPRKIQSNRISAWFELSWGLSRDRVFLTTGLHLEVVQYAISLAFIVGHNSSKLELVRHLQD